MRTIKVTGKGSIRIRPDMTRITITLEGIYPEYSETLEHSAGDTNELKDILEPFGFERSDLRTLSFNVDTEYESYREDDVYKQRFAGYKYTHQMKLEFDSDNDRLGRILYALANCKLHPEFRLSYTVRDIEAVKNELLGKAVADSKEKAAVLTAAAGVSLGYIVSIDYSWGSSDYEISPMSRGIIADNLCLAKSAAYSVNIEPDDITAEDSVTVIWSIE
ncbi:MAG: SIMPL domain-containing protein [Ruminococcus sp.]|nr:SIMPL domain-containing protein [Ruminococcus sp.]